MARKPVSTIKEYFQTGDVPSASQFNDLIDSTYNATSGLGGLQTGFANLSVISLSANEIYSTSSVGVNSTLELSTPSGTTTLTIKNGIITSIV
tara:strand:- start:367 stop:645 length:279 start_codon:yes stop_codon:yes gene_type:complete